MSYQIPEDEYMYSGDVACPGCGAGLAMRLALKALGPRTILVLPASCWSIIAGPFPYSALSVPVYHTAFETGGSTAAGVRAALDMKGDTETTVVTWAGDGGTFDIGLQALSGAVERDENFIYVCYDNEAYMNTGIQRSSATPFGAWTSTTPIGRTKDQPKKDIVGIMAAHRIPYTATANIAYPEDLVRKFQKARAMKGSRFIHILATCPPGWRIASDLSVKVARMAVQTRIFPLYEVENGVKYTINVRPKGLPVSLYLKMQDRFKHLTAEDMAIIQETVDREWERLEDRVASS